MPGLYLSTVGRAIEVLHIIGAKPQAVPEVATRLKIDRHAAYRLLHTLESHGMVQRDQQGRYCLGVRMWELGIAANPHTAVIAAARPHAQQLLEKYGETVHVAIYDAGDVVYIDKLDGAHTLRTYTRLGGRAPALRVATGKALVAHLAPDDYEALFAQQVEAGLDADELERLRAESATIREQGFAVNGGELMAEIGGVAAPILHPSGGPALAAVGLSGPVRRILERSDEIVVDLRERAQRISEALHASG
jgi:DNA-binding IclR family transcriptional regulator